MTRMPFVKILRAALCVLVELGSLKMVICAVVREIAYKPSYRMFCTFYTFCIGNFKFCTFIGTLL